MSEKQPASVFCGQNLPQAGDRDDTSLANKKNRSTKMEISARNAVLQIVKGITGVSMHTGSTESIDR